VWIGLFGFKEIRTTAVIVAGVIEVAAFAIGGMTVLNNAKGSLCTRSPPIPRPDRTATGRALPTGRQ
jgi:hypothetical protein